MNKSQCRAKEREKETDRLVYDSASSFDFYGLCFQRIGLLLNRTLVWKTSPICSKSLPFNPRGADEQARLRLLGNRPTSDAVLLCVKIEGKERIKDSLPAS